MSEPGSLFWRASPRAFAAHAEREDPHESALDRFLVGIQARLRQPFSPDLHRARRFAEQVEREQAWADALGGDALREAARDLRRVLLRAGYTDALSARCFALVRAASGRALGLRHFPVQLMGGYVMLRGMIAEMGTGEGKTLTATLPAAAVALSGMPVHVVTVNDYLAERDAGWMQPVYAALGLSVAVARHEQSPSERRAAYAADVCYCTNKQLGFDYLRDSLTLAGQRGRARLVLEKALGSGDRIDRLLLRGLYFALVDEVDSVLIDESRTPLIISGGGDEDPAADEPLYRAAIEVVAELESEVDFHVHAAEHAVRLSEAGRKRLQELADLLPKPWRSARAREELVQQALAAQHVYHRDKHYIVRDGKVQIVDEFTGRVMADRSWERGLHQLIELKEGCSITGRRGTLARITYQRLFRRYLRLAGMSGTVEEVGPEMDAVYGLRCVRIPANVPSKRLDLGTRVYPTREQKWAAVAEAVVRAQQEGRPVLVGTRSVAASEELSAQLAARGMAHTVLNARQDAEEAAIVAGAGGAGRVTVATNMAGRGTDIAIEPDVVARGGLHVVLTEFHESARIDRQLFGRCARQGDTGSHESIVSLDDEIFRRHAGAATRLLATRYQGRQTPLPERAGSWLRVLAQQAAEFGNYQQRRATMDADRKLDSALGFAGTTE